MQVGKTLTYIKTNKEEEEKEKRRKRRSKEAAAAVPGHPRPWTTNNLRRGPGQRWNKCFLDFLLARYSVSDIQRQRQQQNTPASLWPGRERTGVLAEGRIEGPKMGSCYSQAQ